MASRRAARAWGAGAVAILVGLTLVIPTVAHAGYQLLEHAACVAGPPVARGTYWTPVTMVDSPPDYNNTTEFALASGWAPGVAPAFINVSDGEAAGVFSLDSWQLVSQSLKWTAGPGLIPACPSPVAVDLSRTAAGASQPEENSTVLLPNGSLSDANVPHFVNISAENGTVSGSVWFLANYSRGYQHLGFWAITGVDGMGAGETETFFESVSGGTFFVIVPFVSPADGPMPFPVFLTGVQSTEYTLAGPWYGCIQWGGEISNPFGTGLSFGPGANGSPGCRGAPPL